MANNAYFNKVVKNGTVIIDLTGDTVATDGSDVAYGKTFHAPDGSQVTGSNTKDSDTSDATAAAGDILSGQTAYVRGAKVTGSMANRGAIDETIDDKDDVITVPAGYHDGSGTVQLDSTEKGKLIAGNIKSGVELLGVTGSYTGEGATLQTKSANPSFSAQVIQPDAGYDGLAAVNLASVEGMFTESDNAAGGKTLTIANIS